MNLNLNKSQKCVLVASVVLIVIGGIILSIGLPILVSLTEFNDDPICTIDQLDCKLYTSDPFEITDKDNTKLTTVSLTLRFKTTEIFSESNLIKYNVDLRTGNANSIKEAYVLIDNENRDFSYLNNKSKSEIQPILDQTVEGVYYGLQKIITLHKDSDKQYTATSNDLIFFDVGSVAATVLIIDNENTVHTIKKLHNVFELESLESKIRAVDSRVGNNSNQQMLALTWIGLGLAFILLAGDFIVRVVLNEN